MGNIKYQDKTWLQKKYAEENWSTPQIATFCGVSHKTISRWLEKFNIPTRDPQTAQLTGTRRKERISALKALRDFTDRK